MAVNKELAKDLDKVVNFVSVPDLEDLAKCASGSGMPNAEGKLVMCRCWRSETFPYCDGSHVKHNKETGDNVGPLIIKGGKPAEDAAERPECEPCLRAHGAAPEGRDGDGLVNLAIEKTSPKVADAIVMADAGQLASKVKGSGMPNKEGKLVMCRCWKSKTFPYCDGSHVRHNKETGDNIGPLILSPVAVPGAIEEAKAGGMLAVRAAAATATATAAAAGSGETKEATADPKEGPLIPFSEVAKHNTAGDLWIIVKGIVYDVTQFHKEHPGGGAVVVSVAGTDATDKFLQHHNADIIKLTLGMDGKDKITMGRVDPATLPTKPPMELPAVGAGMDAARALVAAPPTTGYRSMAMEVEPLSVPPLAAMLNLHDFEAAAQRSLVSRGKQQAWNYYSSGADDELTYSENVNAFRRIWLRPRVLVDVDKIDTSRTLLGTRCRLPVYLTAVAVCGLGHDDGELAWMRAAREEDLIFMMPNHSTKSFDEMVEAKGPEQATWFQMYVHPDRTIVEQQLADLEKAGVKALCLTVDSAVPGKRKRDLRSKIQLELGQASLAGGGAGGKRRKPGTFAKRDAALNWGDIAWFKERTAIPLVLKGVACGADAVLAVRHGVQGIVLSNHGGRNLDTSRAGIEILEEVHSALAAEGLLGQLEIFVDGGIRRGSDIFKALALGATAVGLGKPAVFAMSAYGQEGIQAMLQILGEEFEKVMKLMGARDIASIQPDMVITKDLTSHSVPPPPARSPFAIEPDYAQKKIRRVVADAGEEAMAGAGGGAGLSQQREAELLKRIAHLETIVAQKDDIIARLMGK